MIQGNLEYLVSSLPYLSFQDAEEERRRVVSIFARYAGPAAQEKGILSIFEDEAGKFLPPDDFQTLKRIRLEDIHGPSFRKSGNKVLATFSGYAYSLKKDIRQLRLARKSNLEEPAHRKTSLPLIQGNPLEEEIQLMKWQWEILINNIYLLAVLLFNFVNCLCCFRTEWTLKIRKFNDSYRLTSIS